MREFNRKIVWVSSCALFVAMAVATPVTAADQPGYRFEVITAYEPGSPELFTWDINERGDVVLELFDVNEFVSGGVVLARKGDLTQVMQPGDPAPGGGQFGVAPLLMGLGINDAGEISFGFSLDPPETPAGVNIGVYRAAPRTLELSPVVIPGITEAPTGGAFAGVFVQCFVNSSGEIAFTGLCPGLDLEEGPPGVDGLDLGTGVFVADGQDRIRTIVAPGDMAPEGGTFDYASHPSINDAGDVAFGGHLMGGDFVDSGPGQEEIMYCFADIYMKKASTGEIVPIAYLGDPAPGGGEFRCTLDPVINNRGDVMFVGDLTGAPEFFQEVGVYLHTGGETFVVARPGDPMPGGGNVVTSSTFTCAQDLNDRGDVVFVARLDTDTYFDDEGALDTGLYLWSRGSLRLIARTGTVIPGLGTVAHVNAPVVASVPDPTLLLCFPVMNSRGQVAFVVTLTDGRGVILKASPRGRGQAKGF